MDKQGEQTIARQKILLKDRKVFLRFCKYLGITDCDLIFESAAAKESPIDFDELMLGASRVVRATKIDSVFREFVEMTLGESFSSDQIEFDMNFLRRKWTEKQELINKESSSNLVVSNAVHDRIKHQAERIEELENLLSLSSTSEKKRISHSVASFTELTYSSKDSFSQTAALQDDQIHALNDQVKDLTHKLIESQRESDEIYKSKQSIIESLEADIRALRRECTQVGDRLAHLEGEKNKYNFVEELASKQADRDATIACLTAEIQELRIQKAECYDGSPERRIFATNIFIKFVSYAILNDFNKMKSLVPVARDLFHLSDADAEELSALCEDESSGGLESWIPSFS